MAEWIASRRTAQGTIIHLWPDGALTWALGQYVKGSPQPRTPEQESIALSAGWLVLGDVELYSDDEVPALVAAARWAAARGLGPGEMRARLHAPIKLRPVWSTLQTDRDGYPTLQVWRLPRMQWPGLAVWRERGRYAVMYEANSGSGTYVPTGVEFPTLRDLSTYLLSYASR